MSPGSRRVFFLLGLAAGLGGAPCLHGSQPDLSKGRPPLPLDPRVGVNVRLGDDPAALPPTQRGQAEPHLVRSVLNPDLLLATFQEGRYADGGAVDCGYALSRDGGLTWSRALIPNLTIGSAGRYVRATDPVAGFGPQGELYLQTLVSTRGSFETGAVVVSRSLDGGATWSDPLTVVESADPRLFLDKNWLAVNDRAGARFAGRLVSTWSNFTSNSAGATTAITLSSSVSDDQGATWSPAANIAPAGATYQGTQPVFLPDGSLYVVYSEFLSSSDATIIGIRGSLSTDGGRSFPAPPTRIVGTLNGWDDPVLRSGVFLPAATAARNIGELFVAYTAIVAGSPRVLVTKSPDRGFNWTAPVIASDQPRGVSVMNPAIAVSPDGRTVAVVFMDKRNATDGANFVDHYAAVSLDGGVTWQPNLRLTTMSSDVRLAPKTGGGYMLGDYLGLAPGLADDQPFVAVWCDTRTGDADPFIARFTPTATPSFAAWRVAHFSRAELQDPAVSGTSAGPADRLAHPNLVYYEAGNDPHRPGSGETLVLQRPAPDVLDVAWVARADSPVVSELSFALGGDNAQARPSSDAGAAPTLPLPDGLVWRVQRIAPAANDVTQLSRHTSLIVDASDPTTTLYGRSGDAASSRTDSRLINLATRSRSGPAPAQMIVGFVIDGAKSMLIRAAGPALTALGVAGALSDPNLTLTAADSEVGGTNDNWQEGGATAALFGRVGAFPFGDKSRDAALFLPLTAREYTAIVGPGNEASGISLVEAYDADPAPGAQDGASLRNLSTRGNVGPGDDALIAGFVLRGSAPRRILIRAVGPGLASLGIPSAILDPQLALYRGTSQLQANDDWEISASRWAIAATAERIGAFPLAPASRDAALLVTLAPGAYTVVVTGVAGATGVALVEIYDAD